MDFRTSELQRFIRGSSVDSVDSEVDPSDPFGLVDWALGNGVSRLLVTRELLTSVGSEKFSSPDEQFAGKDQ